jgi:hypothetical protein
MRLVEQWRSIGSELPLGWADARLALTVPRADQRERAGFLLSPASPGRIDDTFHFTIRKTGGAIGPDQCTKLLGKLDEDRIRGTLALRETVQREARTETPRDLLAAAWTAAVSQLPPDWSDLYCEVELGSSDHLQRGALLLAPVNPARVPGRSAFRFRVAQSFGYGASPQMTARCLERLDEDGIPGSIAVLHSLSDTHNVATQGPVWRVAGKAV